MKVLRSLFLLVGVTTLAACAQPQGADAPVASAPVPASAPAEPASAPQASVKHSFTVYFDTNKADIRASAMQILYGAAQLAKGVKPPTIRVHGYTDAAGKAAYNQKLSERRAATVADQLRKLGLTVTIETRGFGERDPTAEGSAKSKSKESRRVEISFESSRPAAASNDASAVRLSDTAAMHGVHPVLPSSAPKAAEWSATASPSVHDPVPETVTPAAMSRIEAHGCSAWRAPSCRAPPGQHGT